MVRRVVPWVATVFVVALVAAGCGDDGRRIEAEPGPLPAGGALIAPAPPVPRAAFEAADAISAEVPVYSAPSAAEPEQVLTNPTDEDVPLAFLVRDQGPPGWLLVQVPERPNGRTGWIREADIVRRGVPNRIVVSLDARELVLYRGLTDEVLFRAPVAIGSTVTPTPLGQFYVDVVVDLIDKTGPYGSYQLSIAGFSDVLFEFGGGPGQIAIHGTNRPELIGQAISNGCVRMTNEDITALVQFVTSGTPVEIVA